MKPVLGLLLLVIFTSSLTYFLLSNMVQLKSLIFKQVPSPSSAPAKVQKPAFTVADFRKSMVKDIRTTFATSQDAGIMAYVDLAGQEKNEFQSYQYYVKAFNKMKEAYMKNANEASSSSRFGKATPAGYQKLSMVELKAYVSPLKYYKKSDFVIPK